MKNNQIEGLRGITIILIVLFHLFVRYNQIFLNQKLLFFNHIGSFGVCIFFLISFYYMSNKKNSFRYLIKKILRLYPSYLLSIIIIYLILLLFPIPSRNCSMLSFILNIFLINGFIGFPYVDGAHWYLKVLIAHIIINFFLSRIDVNKKIVVSYVILFLLVLFKYLNFNFFSSLFGGQYFVIYVLGFCLYNLRNDFKEKNISKKWICLFFVSIFLIPILFDFSHLIYMIIIVPLFIYTINKKISFFAIKPLQFLGTISYPFYLIHQNISYVIIFYLSKVYGHYNLLFAIIAFIVVFFVSIFIYYFYEKPIQKKISMMFN